MITLDGSLTTAQAFNVTPQEARQWTSQNFTVYLFEAISQVSDRAYYWIGARQVDNDRYTQIQINISVDNPTAGNVLITERGLFRYTIYGQTSLTNLDPTNASVVGILETGVMRITGETGYSYPNFATPDSYIYYE